MAIPSDYATGVFSTTQSVDRSVNSVNTLYITNTDDRLFVVNVPASFATGKTICRNPYLTTSETDVYYGDSEIGKLDAPLEGAKQCGFTVNEAGSLVVWAPDLENTGIYRTYGSGFNFDSPTLLFRRDVGTVRTYTGISGFFSSPSSIGEGTVAKENKIYLNNEGPPGPFPFPTGSWNNVAHNPNAVGSTLDETSNYTIKKRGCFSVAEYITDDGQTYAPEGLVRTFVTPPSYLPSKVVNAGTNAMLWVCSKPLNKISLTVSTNFTDPDGVARVKGEVLIENNIASKSKYSPISLGEDIPYTSSDGIVFKALDWICFYVGCTDGYIRVVCWNLFQSTSIMKDDRGCLWVAYEAQP